MHIQLLESHTLCGASNAARVHHRLSRLIAQAPARLCLCARSFHKAIHKERRVTWKVNLQVSRSECPRGAPRFTVTCLYELPFAICQFCISVGSQASELISELMILHATHVTRRRLEKHSCKLCPTFDASHVNDQIFFGAARGLALGQFRFSFDANLSVLHGLSRSKVYRIPITDCSTVVDFPLR